MALGGVDTNAVNVGLNTTLPQSSVHVKTEKWCVSLENGGLQRFRLLGC